MSKICPNCLRPVRTGANFCGYCGSNLIPVTSSTSSSAQPALQDYVDTNLKSTPSERPNHIRNKARRPWVLTPIIFLCLVILLALVLRFWPDISNYLALMLTSIRLP